MMDFDELNDFTDWETKRVGNAFHKTNGEMILIDNVQLLKAARKFTGEVKKKRMNRMRLGMEFANVVVIASMLAKRLNLDISQSVENKVELLRARRY